MSAEPRNAPADLPVPSPEHGGVVAIDLAALAANYQTLRRITATAETAAVIKADGYGLGAAEIAGALIEAGCRTFFVAHLDEGLALRTDARFDGARLIVLNGPVKSRLASFADAGLEPVLSTPDQVRAACDFARAGGPVLPVTLQVETGMNRLGLDEAGFRHALAAAAEGEIAPRLVMSHLACADTPDDLLNERQRARFEALLALAPGLPASLANSNGVLLGPGYQFDLTRPGIALYGGLGPIAGQTWQTVVTLTARVLQIKTIADGEAVGYGATFTAVGARRIATVSAGYGDGVIRLLGNRGFASVAGRRVPYAGRVSMDLLALDISGLPEDALDEGDAVELIGPDVPAHELAAQAETISYELFTRLGPRLARVYKSP